MNVCTARPSKYPIVVTAVADLSSKSAQKTGIIPNLWAMYSSCRHVVFRWTSTKSIARVGTSEIMIRRRVLATDVSVEWRMNFMEEGVLVSTLKPGVRTGMFEDMGGDGEWRSERGGFYGQFTVDG